MSAQIRIVVVADEATPALNQLAYKLGRRVVHEAIGAAMLNVVRTHFDRRAQEPNKMGAPSTGFWSRISNGCSSAATDNEAVVTIPAPILQKVNGGWIRPVNGQAIAFPISPLSYGKSARGMRDGGGTKYIPIKSKKNPDVVGVIRSIDGQKVLGEALFLVMKRVYQPKDPNALPPMEKIAKAAIAAAEEQARILTE